MLTMLMLVMLMLTMLVLMLVMLMLVMLMLTMLMLVMLMLTMLMASMLVTVLMMVSMFFHQFFFQGFLLFNDLINLFSIHIIPRRCDNRGLRILLSYFIRHKLCLLRLHILCTAQHYDRGILNLIIKKFSK